jgi:hypothetical protein
MSNAKLTMAKLEQMVFYILFTALYYCYFSLNYLSLDYFSLNHLSLDYQPCD